MSTPTAMAGQEKTHAANTHDSALALEFVQFAVESGVLRFGEFKTKAGRLSPYFFNAGLFDDGAKLGRLAQFYARGLLQQEKTSGLQFDMIFGPAYKGIPLAAAVAVELARLGRNVPFAYNRKEAKDHGEGGTLVGAPVQGRVLIIDDVMSAGTAARESIAIIRAAGAIPHAVAIALDRQEKATENGVDVDHSAVQFVTKALGLQVFAIARLTDLLQYLAQADKTPPGGVESNPGQSLQAHYQRVLAYRQRYGVDEGISLGDTST
jgi:orotate phosphoribosyltransferase